MNDIMFKTNIREFDYKLDIKTKEEIIYRVISINNTYFFAEEISTGCIFPIYYFEDVKNNSSYKGGTIFQTHSNVKYGKYFVFADLSPTDKPFQFKVNTSNVKWIKPSIDEVNQYLEEKKKDINWIYLIKTMEELNKYNFDLSLIKSILAEEKEKQSLNESTVEETDEQYQNYIPQLDISKISEFGHDLSTRKDLCNLVGREEEKKKIIKTIAIGGDSILLVGPSGVGKTVIVESLALDIRNKTNSWLEDKIIFNLTPSSLVADAKYRGTFEKSIKEIIDFCIENKGEIILFIDEIHTLYGLGRTEDSSIDAMNILKPYIESGNIIVIGATTKDEYQKYMASDPAFLRRFEIEEISAPTKQMNIEILLAYIVDLEKKYDVKLKMSDKEKSQIVDHILTITDTKNQRVVGDIKIENPTISKKLLKEAFTEAVYNRKATVTLDEICYAIGTCDKLTPTLKEKAIIEIKAKLVHEDENQKQSSHLKLIRTR